MIERKVNRPSMTLSKRLRRLLPVLLIAAAGSAALIASPSNAQEASGGGTGSTNSRGGDITANDQPTGSVGSGRENYYVPKGGGLPDVANPGQYLYEQGCSTCHGLKGQGKAASDVDPGVPTLIGVGKAGVDFWVGTGRMPLSTIIKQAPRKTPIYTQDQIDAIAEYVDKTFAGGPAVPLVHEEGAEITVNGAEGDLVEGNQLYASNCAQCHNSAGSGGSLGRDYNAPRLYEASPTQVAEAIRIGPGPMPLFGPNTFSDAQTASIVEYVEELGNKHPGGLKLGATGPVPEGFFGWLVGLAAMLALARWIGTRV